MAGTGLLLAGRYRLDERIGAGGMGEVWRAVDERLDRPVAVKLLLADQLESDDAVRRFHREARVTARLAGHPNIVILFDYGEHEGSVYAVMELVTGPTLQMGAGAATPWPVRRAADLGAQACTGLAAAHTAGIVHRDIKPANLMLGAEGIVKIVDFGIAGLEEATTRSRQLTKTGQLLGTPLYMPPELVHGQTLTARGDLYSLGAVLYQLLTGRPPFPGEEPLHVLRMHLTEPPVPPDQLRPEIPEQLSDLVVRLLAKDPEDRPDDARAVAQELTFFAAPGSSVPQVTLAESRYAAPAEEPDLQRRIQQMADMVERGEHTAVAQQCGALITEAERSLGADHSEVLTLRRRHAYALGKSGAPGRAAEQFAALVTDLDRVLGTDHPETLAARFYWAVNSARAGAHGEAARIHEDLIPGLQRVHGADSPRTMQARLHLAFDVGEAGDHRRARDLLVDLVSDLERVMGPDHRTTATARQYLAAHTGHAGDAAGAARLYAQLVTDHEKKHGPDHPTTAKLRSHLTRWQRVAG